MRRAAGRVVGFALVAVFVMSAVGLAASQTFINKTGKTVTGIKVEFSKSVRITRHDSVFPDQAPTGRAREFTFSGGELRNSGRFNISWVPSSAKVTDYEWIKKAQPEQTSQATSPSSNQESGLPDPNTQPILYGDDYPGPDEPLYQPADDEQIWLTDLDGHADIYDNDGIRINYAPGFDKSQITKIDVYRNGIKLRFLPDTFDMLTNAQMKTFDGNYREHSPASNHTDHAIMGYEYKFKIQTADHLWVLVKTVKSPVHFSGKKFIDCGLLWLFLYHTDQEIEDHFRAMKALGFTGIQFEVYYFIPSYEASDVFASYDRPNVALESYQRTMTPEEIRRVLRLIDEVGMDAEIRIELWLGKEYKRTHPGCDREGIHPSDVDLWFANYTDLCMKIGALAEQGGADIFCVGVELSSMEPYADYWRALAAKVRTVFSGKLTFAEATCHFLSGFNCYDNSIGLEGSLGKFWDAFDIIGVNQWPSFSLETSTDQRYSVIRENFIKEWSKVVDYYRKRFPGKEIRFDEMGTYVHDGIALGLSYRKPSSSWIPDEQEVADTWAAYLAGAEFLGIDGICAWRYGVDRWKWYPGTIELAGSPAPLIIGSFMKK